MQEERFKDGDCSEFALNCHNQRLCTIEALEPVSGRVQDDLGCCV